MIIATFNCGSSSVKAALIDTAEPKRLKDVRAANIRTTGARLIVDGVSEVLASTLAFEEVVTRVLDALLKDSGRIDAVAHRIVHGGSRYLRPVVITADTLADFTTLDRLAPLHNPPARIACGIVRRYTRNLPQVAVFDTTFHGTLPRRAYQYPLPSDLASRRELRRRGFHGISHAHVMEQVARHMRAAPQDLRIISCHLGNGASVAAIEYGRSVETSMGMTPLEGLVMGTRGGDIDPGLLLELLESGECDVRALAELLNHGAGLKGMTGTEDMARIEERAAAGDESCRAAIAVYTHRLRKYIGAYAAVMGGVDVIAFTAGVGENSALVRHRALQRLQFLGAMMDEDRNRDAHVAADTPVIRISEENSRVRVLVIKADEETAMAAAAAEVLTAGEQRWQPRIPIAISARHAHLSRGTLDHLFGKGYQPHARNSLSQPGQYASNETVSLIGPRGRIDGVRVLGPPREQDQIEISRGDEFILGVDAPVRISGDLKNTPGITIEGPQGRLTLSSGLICAKRHIHMHPDDAVRLGAKDHQVVDVQVETADRGLIFKDVSVRVSPEYRLEMHVDFDEANAAGLTSGDTVKLI